MTGSSQEIYTDTAKKKEYYETRDSVNNLIRQKNLSLDILLYQIEKDSLPKK